MSRKSTARILALLLTAMSLPAWSSTGWAADGAELSESRSFTVRGLGNSRVKETRLTLSGDRYRLVFGARYSKFKAAIPLTSPFDGAFHHYDRGELINTRFKKTWYEMSYLRTLPSCRLLGRPLSVSLGGGMALLTHSYGVGSSREFATRTQSDLIYRFGGEASWRLGQRTSLAGQVYLPAPVAGIPNLTSLDLTASFELWRLQETRLNLVAGASWHHVEHTTRLPSPDTVRLMTGPLLRFGMELAF